ncbi:hypothetical protein BaRGS_00035846 [Batillaria attramentaria]|uniref:Uncharacterized protein n=1 Tax=Batillaria attramentaria TaxID=370345 RepID=A0ABD0JEA2_9CAEN
MNPTSPSFSHHPPSPQREKKRSVDPQTGFSQVKMTTDLLCCPCFLRTTTTITGPTPPSEGLLDIACGRCSGGRDCVLRTGLADAASFTSPPNAFPLHCPVVLRRP